jgi:hypothetical protein
MMEPQCERMYIKRYASTMDKEEAIERLALCNLDSPLHDLSEEPVEAVVI